MRKAFAKTFSSRVIFMLVVGVMMLMLSGCDGHIVGMLNPKGVIAHEERKLFFDTLALMLIVVLPVIIMSFAFVYHYQVSHRLKEYKPNWSHSVLLETLWWGIPIIIILVLAILTWKKTFELDPYKRISGYPGEPLQIQVIALPWKWLFIYPAQNIATLNYLVIPAGEQVEYLMTADNVPMSAFFIPQIGSQIYVMAGMKTRLHLVANEVGSFDGLDTLYNGSGFSGMHFETQVIAPEKMQAWFAQIQKSSPPLTEATYNNLLTPADRGQPQSFSSVPPNLFENVIDLYMNTIGKAHPRHDMGKYT